MNFLKLTSLTCLTCSVFAAQAAEPSTAEVELGVIATSGNTESTSLKGKVTINQELENWKNNYQLDALYKKDEVTIGDETTNKTTAQKLFVSAQGDYKLSEKHAALFVYGSYADDRFSGFDYQSTIAIGYSDQLFSNAKSFLNYNIGPGYTFSKTNDTTDDTGAVIEGDEENAAVLRLAAEYQYKFSDHAKFTQLLSTEAAFNSDDNTRSKSETAVSANLMGNLSMKAAFTVTHNSQVPDNKKKTDTTTSITLVYLF